MMRWVVIGMTITTVAVTLWDAAFGHEIGRVFLGTALSVAGIFIVALWVPKEEG